MALLLVDLLAATALIVPMTGVTPTITIVQPAAITLGSVGVTGGKGGIFPASTLIADEALSPAKARIEAAKRAQQEKLAKRGYGDGSVAAPVVAAAPTKTEPKLPEKPKTFAQLLDESIQQRESLAGRLSDEEVAKLTSKLRAAYPGLD